MMFLIRKMRVTSKFHDVMVHKVWGHPAPKNANFWNWGAKSLNANKKQVTFGRPRSRGSF